MSDPHSEQTTPQKLGATGGHALGDVGRALPCQVGQYRLLEKLGEGGMGTVYKALHTSLRRPVALKMMRFERAGNPHTRQRFLREAAAAGRLDHPNIVRATDAAEHDGQPFLVMELLDGLDLQKVLRRCRTLGVADACELVRQAALGLQYAHERGLVHRDVKPSNLQLTAAGSVKVLDLGLARLGPDPLSGEDFSASEPVLGTVDYIAPEQATDPRAVDTRADVYSLGCTLYALLAGEPPFNDRATLYAKMKAHAEDAPPPLVGHRPDVPAPLAALVGRLLAKSPDDRPATPGEAARELAPFAEGAALLPLLAEAQGRGRPPRDSTPLRPAGSVTPTVAAPSARWAWLTRPAWRRAALAALALSLAFGLFLLVGPARETTDPGERPPEVLPMPKGEFVPGVWHPLLADPPEKLQWPAAARVTALNHRPELREVDVNAFEGTVLLRFGEASWDDYDLRVKLHQTQWARVGLFFGYHDDVYQNKPVKAYQLISLVPTEQGPGGSWALARHLMRREDGRPPHRERIEQHAVDDPGVFDVELCVQVRKGELAEVKWGGTVFRDLSHPLANQHAPAAYHKGAFGLYAERSQAVCRDAAFRFPPKEDP